MGPNGSGSNNNNNNNAPTTAVGDDGMIDPESRIIGFRWTYE